MGKILRNSEKPLGRTSAFTFFLKTTKEERMQNPGESLSSTEFFKQACEMWKNFSNEDKKKYEEMEAQDFVRYQEEMANYVPTGGEKRKRNKKDSNAPKAAVSAYAYFSLEQRPKIIAEFPAMPVKQVTKELGKRWKLCKKKTRYQTMATKDKERYESEKASYIYAFVSMVPSDDFSHKEPAASKNSTKAKFKPLSKKRKVEIEQYNDEIHKEDDEDDAE
ncbi:hypothetical protein HELRODRAFT_91744 [Helobdella robusta]|uniref:HMG box domain-containing protein n=1 Tax=Helobdella robusta TaxID=6412 RepID=T1G883_HELRO|nr:hypothetical protein HELRODRAFT_91744 [Helobdella robusta]ESO10511.1 hypothetical protein HELRODRAFT_91744 [Helobdella robusta]